MGTCTAEIKDARRRANGDPTYQVEVLLTYSGVEGPTGSRERTMAIRGPCRTDRQQAQQDADQLESAAKDGIKAVRELAIKLKRGTVGRS